MIIKEEKDKLVTRIWKTKKARMNAEERLLVTNNILQWLMLCYTLLITFLSVFSLIQSIDWLNYTIVISSITITVLSIFINSKNYVQRAYEMRINYTKLGELEYELTVIDDSLLSSNILVNLNKKYQELLRGVENHKEEDYSKIENKFSMIQKTKIFFVKAIVMLAFLIPLSIFVEIIIVYLEIKKATP